MQIDLDVLNAGIRREIRAILSRERVAKKKKVAKVEVTKSEDAMRDAWTSFLFEHFKSLLNLEILDDINAQELPLGSNAQASCVVENRTGPPSKKKKVIEVSVKLGKGAFGSVFQVSRDRAVKLIEMTPSYKTPDKVREDFLREVEMMKLAEKGAPGVAPKFYDAYACCSKNGRCYGVILMELVRGDSLRHHQNNMSEGKLKVLAEKVRSAIDRLHKAGVYHNDLHPGNVMVTRGGHVKILDFGMADRVPGWDRGTFDKKNLDYRIVDDIMDWKNDDKRLRWEDAKVVEMFSRVLSDLVRKGVLSMRD